MSNDTILIIKKKGSKINMSVKVRKKVKKGFVPDQYIKVLNPFDYKDLSLLLEDLDLIIGAPIDKAIMTYRNKRKKDYPFF